MRILAIETSCDETAVALLEVSGPLEDPKVDVLGNSLLSQIHIHKEYGGVYPNLAKREHQKNLPPLLKKTLKEAGEDPDSPGIDCIAVTEGPGLEPALWVGITFAEELGERWGKPVIPVNHMAGHIFSVLYPSESPIRYPALALLVSGGHTELVLVEGVGRYEMLGQTRDDAVGEAFDKVARLLGLPYPGGPKISSLASISRERGEDAIRFPRPMLQSKDLDFSYSGLKTAVLYHVKGRTLAEEDKQDIARAFEDAAIEVLIEKTRRALTAHPEARTLIVGGGVSANAYLRSELAKLSQEFPEVNLRMPTQSLATDNAVMIGIAAYMKRGSGQSRPLPIEARGNLRLA